MLLTKRKKQYAAAIQVNKRQNIKCKQWQKTGFNKIKCADYNKSYLGQTGRSFKNRYEEQIPAPRIDKQKSIVAQHIVNHIHTNPNNLIAR